MNRWVIRVFVTGVVVVLVWSFTLGYVLRFSADTVASGSMSPYLERGDVVIVQHVNPSDIYPGAVIVYKSTDSAIHDSLIVHRVVRLNWLNGSLTGIVTKGDRNPYPDSVYGFEPVQGISPGLVVGMVVGVISYLGSVPLLLVSPFGIALLASLILASLGLDLARYHGRSPPWP